MYGNQYHCGRKGLVREAKREKKTVSASYLYIGKLGEIKEEG